MENLCRKGFISLFGENFKKSLNEENMLGLQYIEYRYIFI